jgi:phosphoserine phosphatase
MAEPTEATTHFLFASDFDQTLSFHDSGRVLAEILGVTDFDSKVAGLAASNLVQQGGELAYLIRHDPAFRTVRREHLAEAGRRVRLRSHIPQLVDFLSKGVEGYSFSFYVVSAAPREVILAALDGIVPPDHIVATELDYDPSGEVRSVVRVPAGYGKVAAVERLEQKLEISPDHTIYVGDGSSDVHVMLHVNNRDGFTIAVSENKHIARIARRTVLSDNAFSVLVPVFEHIVGWKPAAIRTLFESYGLALHEWEKAHTDWVTVRERPATPGAAVA